MREINLTAAIGEGGTIIWNATASNDDREVEYQAVVTGQAATGQGTGTALEALMLLAQELYARVHDLEARLAEHYGA